MKILYIGQNSGNSYHRYQALKSLGHDVFLVDPFSYIPSNRWVGKWIYETGALGFNRLVEKRLLFAIRSMRFDLVWVNLGQLLNPDLVAALHRRYGLVVNFFNDNILYRRNYRKWRLFRKSISKYDLIVALEESHAQYMLSLGAQKVIRMHRIADEKICLKSLVISKQERELFASDVCFVGTWIPGRGECIKKLLEKGIPVSIWGDRWQKSKEWSYIKKMWRGPGTYSGDNYVKILKTSKICLCLLIMGDLHTVRSVEIPAVGALLCAERTMEHLQMYEEGKEAVFWDDADECANICRELLEDAERRKEIAKRGHERCLKNNYFNEPTLSKIIAYTMGIK